MIPYQMHTHNFMGLTSSPRLPFAVVGVPFDGATSYRAGARMGPEGIRQASRMLVDGVHPVWHADLTTQVQDAGNFTCVNNMTQAHAQILSQAQSLLNTGTHMVTMGGDHSITTPLMEAHACVHGKLAVLHLDAHCDTWSDHFGEPRGHGTWVRDVVESGWVHADHMVSLGIRSPTCVHAQSYLKHRGGRTLSAQDVFWYNPVHIAHDVREKLADLPVYLSVDIDVLDPAHAPGTGTPEAAGLSMIWVQCFLRHLFLHDRPVHFVGMDMVEVAPAYDHHEITSLAAATLMWEYLSAQCAIKGANVTKM